MIKMNAMKMKRSYHVLSFTNICILLLIVLYIYQIVFFNYNNEKYIVEYIEDPDADPFKNNRDIKLSDIISLKNILEKENVTEITIDHKKNASLLKGKTKNIKKLFSIIKNTENILLKDIKKENNEYYFSIRIL